MKTLHTFSALLFVTGSLLFTGCEPVETVPPVLPQSTTSLLEERTPIMLAETAPVLERISPAEGRPGAIVHLYGLGFSLTNEGNIISFGDSFAASVKVMNTNMLAVTVPARAKTGPIRIVVDGKTCLGPIFTITSTD